MVVPFGFSIGDFIVVADKFKDICVALKDHGGAAADYQTTVKKLETTKAVLLSLNDLKSNGTSLGLLNAIRTQAASLGQDVGLFLKDIKPYEGDLGCGSAKGFRHGVSSKIKWAQYVSKKVSKLDESTAYHVSILQTLLGMHTVDAISRLTQTVGNLDPLLRSNHHNIHQDLQSVKDLITTQAASNTGYHTIIDSQLRSNQHNTHQDLQSIKSLIISQFRHLNERFPSQTGPSSTLAQMIPYGPVVSSATTVGGATRIFRCFIDQPTMTGSNQGAMVALARSHPSLSPHQINDTLGNLETIIQFVIAYVLIALKELLIRLPQVLIIARVMQVLPRAISLMRQDCIRFEDALGRVQNLQYQQFQYWLIFEAMIKTQFEGVPGNGKILRRQYTLMCPGLHGQRLVAASWSQHVFPGMTVFMAVDVKIPDFHGGRCPKCSRSNTSSHSATGLRCYSCGLVFSKGFATDIVIAGGAAESENSGACVERLHPNGRLISGPSAEAGDNEAAGSNDEFTDSEDATENLKVFKRVNLLQKPVIQGNGGDHEELGHRYYRRPDAKKFFVVGRVFAMLWHEYAGNAGDNEDRYLIRCRKGRFGETLYSYILQMAVFKERHGYCLCSPIIPYNRQGVARMDLGVQDRMNHSIIYMDDTKPAIAPAEEGMMLKKPIAVTAANSRQKLHHMSRINFGKVYSVGWGVKVMNVGKVHENSMAAFIAY